MISEQEWKHLGLFEAQNVASYFMSKLMIEFFFPCDNRNQQVLLFYKYRYLKIYKMWRFIDTVDVQEEVKHLFKLIMKVAHHSCHFHIRPMT